MQRTNAVQARHVCQCTRHPQAAMHDARRPAPALHGLGQQLSALLVQHTVTLYIVGAESGIGGLLPVPLARAAALYAHAYRLGRLAWREIDPARFGRRQGYLQIHSIQQGTGELVPVCLDHVGRTPAVLPFVPQPPARTGVHGGHQLEGRGEGQGAGGPCNGDAAGFQRFTQRLQDPALELGQFVQKKHTVVSQADFPRPGIATSTVRFINK